MGGELVSIGAPILVLIMVIGLIVGMGAGDEGGNRRAAPSLSDGPPPPLPNACPPE